MTGINEPIGTVWRIYSEESSYKWNFVDVLRLEELNVIASADRHGKNGQRATIKLKWKDGKTESDRKYKRIYPFNSGFTFLDSLYINAIEELHMQNGDQKEIWRFDNRVSSDNGAHSNGRVYDLRYAASQIYADVGGTGPWSWEAYKALIAGSAYSGASATNLLTRFSRYRGDQLEYFFPDHSGVIDILSTNGGNLSDVPPLDPFQIIVNVVTGD